MVVHRESRSLLRSGFTLIELMVAIAILALLAGGAVPMFLGYLERAKVSAAKTDIQTFKAAILNYQMGMNKYPQTLKDLIKAPREEQDKKRWTQSGGPFLEGDEIKVDSWDNPYKYKLTPGTPHPYELFSYGKNGPGAPKEEQISVWDK